MSRAEARLIEPSLVGIGDQVIYSPTTSVMDTKQALKIMKDELIEQGVNVEVN
jgi:L-2-hydroxyglutarate oxidase LhgO